jgi:hypothetical protein
MAAITRCPHMIYLVKNPVKPRREMPAVGSSRRKDPRSAGGCDCFRQATTERIKARLARLDCPHNRAAVRTGGATLPSASSCRDRRDRPEERAWRLTAQPLARGANAITHSPQRDAEPTSRVRKRLGRCYELSWKALMELPRDTRWKLVHGQVVTLFGAAIVPDRNLKSTESGSKSRRPDSATRTRRGELPMTTIDIRPSDPRPLH